MTPPIVVCSIGSPSLKVLEASVEAYAPETELIVHHGSRSTFGEAYNYALEQAFKKHDEVIIANDDAVITPDTMKLLMEDVQVTKEEVGSRFGLMGAMCDNARPCQNIRFNFMQNDYIRNLKWESERKIKQVEIIAPIFAWISKKAFEAVKFPPITWWSDDVMCEDLVRKGFLIFISRAYVHHAMSQTVGTDFDVLMKEALPWVKANRPEYLEEFERRRLGVSHG